MTLPLHTNYGGILQAWALQTVLERMGHESSHVFRHLLGPLILYKDMSDAEIAAFQRHTARFVDRYIRCDETPLGAIAPDRYDAFVVGSDQIWRNRYTDFFHIGLANAFLLFADSWNVRRIAYAPSFVTDSFHATVFSILFGKPFVVTGNPKRGLSRIESLLKALGLEDHLAMTAADFDPARDYGVPSSAYQRLSALRQTGVDFLSAALA